MQSIYLQPASFSVSMSRCSESGVSEDAVFLLVTALNTLVAGPGDGNPAPIESATLFLRWGSTCAFAAGVKAR